MHHSTMASSLAEAEEHAKSLAVCMFCLKEAVKYTCPRCNQPYCSVACYKSEKHQDCSEMFYKDCFMEGLKDFKADPADKQKILEMIQRAETDPDLGDLDDESNDLYDRLADLDLDKVAAKIWDRLTDKEKKEFQTMVSDGRLGNLMDIWTPWWSPGAMPLVTEVTTEADKKLKQMVGGKPDILANIPKLSALTKAVPASDIKYSIVNILYAYAFICRLHNGEHAAMATESAKDFMELSDVIGRQATLESTSDAIQASVNRLQSQGSLYESTNQFNINVMNDVKLIITSSPSDNPLDFILSSLSEVCRIMKKAYKLAAKMSKTDRLSEKQRKQQAAQKSMLFKCVKKCEFLLSWVQSYGMCLYELIPELELEIARCEEELETVEQSKHSLEAEWGGQVRPRKKALIEEL